jgi:hypothetical protein
MSGPPRFLRLGRCPKDKSHSRGRSAAPEPFHGEAVPDTDGANVQKARRHALFQKLVATRN